MSGGVATVVRGLVGIAAMHRLVCALVLSLVSGANTPANAEPGHEVLYVVTADGDREVTIHYRVDMPTENWHGAKYENFWIGPDKPWRQTVFLDDPYVAYVSVRNIWWNPNFHCELWMDGVRVQQGGGYCSLKGKRPGAM